MASRGIRNNNPGNIRKSNDPWQGLADQQPDPEFFTFKDAVYGIRALARILITYYDKYGCDTVHKAIYRWAPENENNSAAYAQDVAARMGVGSTSIIDFHAYVYMRPMVEAIIWHENGQQPYTSAQIDKGLALACIEPPQKALAKSSTIKASTIGGGVTVATGGISAITELAQQAPSAYEIRSWLDIVHDYGPYMILAACIVIAGMFGWIAYRRWDDARRLAR